MVVRGPDEGRSRPDRLWAVVVAGTAALLVVAGLAWGRSADTKLSPFLDVVVTPAGAGTVRDPQTGDTCTASCRWGYGNAAGGQPPSSVALTATASAGYSLSGWSTPGCTGGACAVPLSPNGGNVTVTFSMSAPPPPPPPAPRADLGVAKAVDRTTAVVGDLLTYTITVSSKGPDAATGVSLTDTPPAGTTVVSAAATQGSCTGAAPVVCALGSLGPGASATVTVKLAARAVGTVVNQATVKATEVDPDAANQSSSAATTVAEKPLSPPVPFPAPIDPCARSGTNRVDVLLGSLNRDHICGLSGDDTIWGDGGADRLEGNAGDDLVVGGPGRDTLLGGAGWDELRACDGAPDTLDGGPGHDHAWVDPSDTTIGIEEVRRCATRDKRPAEPVIKR